MQQKRRKTYDASTPIGRVFISTSASQVYANVLQRRLGAHTISQPYALERPEFDVGAPPRSDRRPALESSFLARPFVHPSVDLQCASCRSETARRPLFTGSTYAPWQMQCEACAR